MARPLKRPYRPLPQGISQDQIDRLAISPGRSLLHLKDDILGSLPKECQQRVLKHLRVHHGYGKHSPAAKERRAAWAAAKAKHGVFFVTKYHVTPPPLPGNVVAAVNDWMALTVCQSVSPDQVG